MPTYRTHAAADRFLNRTKCGLAARQMTKNGDRYLPLAQTLAAITCKNCLEATYDPRRRR